MDLLNIPLFRGGIAKQAKYLVSTPQKAQSVVLIAESGVVSQEYLPMSTGFVSTDGVVAKKTWLVMHNLKFQVHKKGVPTNEAVLLLSERSYIPLDPYGVIKTKDREKLTSLTDIARLRHAEARSDTGKNEDSNTHISRMIINSCFVLMGIFAVITMIKGC